MFSLEDICDIWNELKLDLRDFHFKRYLIWCVDGCFTHLIRVQRRQSVRVVLFQGGKQMCRTGAGGGLGLFRLGPPAIRHTTGTKPRVDPGSPGSAASWHGYNVFFVSPSLTHSLKSASSSQGSPGIVIHLEVIRCSNKLTNEKSPNPVVPILLGIHPLDHLPPPWYLGLNLGSHIRENLEQKPIVPPTLVRRCKPRKQKQGQGNWGSGRQNQQELPWRSYSISECNWLHSLGGWSLENHIQGWDDQSGRNYPPSGQSCAPGH